MPKPRKDENREDYLQRCMGSAEMVSEFPDSDQRYAVCNSYWRDRKDAMSEIKHKNVSLEMKFSDDDEWSFEGYGSIYGVKDDGGDIIMPGAFDASLASGRRVKMLWQHDPSKPIGIWDKISSDSRGLNVKGRLLKEIAQAREAHALMKANAIDGLSIGYRTRDFERDGPDRKLKTVDLWEISVVTFPMNTEALVTDVKQLQSTRDVERILRDAGVPIPFAKLVAAHGFEEAKARLNDDQRDVDVEKDKREQLDALISQLKSLKEAFHA